jgi:predicted O-methyltransferase YrrM
METRYWMKAVGSLVRNLRHKAFAQDLLRSGLVADAARKAPEVHILKMYPQAKRELIPMGDVRFRVYNMDPMEQYCLAVIARIRQPKRIFEIGTFDGATSLLLARSVPDAHVFTLDLPPAAVEEANEHLQRALSAVDGEGSRFRGEPEAARITQLYGDSRTFDFSPYYGQMDLVVVDGGHEADCVVPDTEHALAMLAPGGVVVWDDYTTNWPAVVAAVDHAAERRGLAIVRPSSTEFALYDSSGPVIARVTAGAPPPSRAGVS